MLGPVRFGGDLSMMQRIFCGTLNGEHYGTLGTIGNNGYNAAQWERWGTMGTMGTLGNTC